MGALEKMEQEAYSQWAWQRMMENYDYEVAASEFDADEQLEQIQRIQQQQTDSSHGHLDLIWPWDSDEAFSMDQHYEESSHQQQQEIALAADDHGAVTTTAVHDDHSTCVVARPDLREQLLYLIKTGSLQDRMNALMTLKKDFYTLQTFLFCNEGIHELLDILALDAIEQSDPFNTSSNIEAHNQLDWKSVVWELLLLIVHNVEPLYLDIQDIRQVAILPVLALVQKEQDACYRRMALRFLLAEPIRCATCQDVMVDSGGLTLLVNALAVERDYEALELLLELLRQAMAMNPSYQQAIDLTVQDIVDRNDASEIEFTNLLLVHQEQVPTFPPSTTEAERKEQLEQFILQASTNTLYLASSSLLHKYIALNCVRKALPEIGLAFVFDHDGIPLLWDVLMHSEAGSLNALAVDILRYLAREDDAFRDHIIDFYTQYAAVQEMETKIKTAALRCEILGERNKRKRSDTDATDEWIELPSGTSELVSIPKTQAVEAQADQITSGDCEEFRLGNTPSDSDIDDLEEASDTVADTAQDLEKRIISPFKEACSSDDDWEIVGDGEC